MFENISQREKIMLVIAVLAIICVLYYFYVYKPANNEIDQLQGKIEQKENKVETARKYANMLSDLENKYDKLDTKLKMRKSAYVEKSKIDLLIDFREIARENNVDLLHFRPEKKDEGMVMDILFSGRFRPMCNLFSDFRDWNYWFEFKNLNIQGKEDKINVSLSVIYHDKDFEGGDNS